MSTKPNRTKKTTPTHVNTTELSARLEALKQKHNEEIERLAKQLARGTGDVAEQAAVAVKAAQATPSELPERLEMLLRERPQSFDELVQQTKEPAGRVQSALKLLRKRIVNIGAEDAPRWFWFVGDEAATAQLNAAVEALVRDRPMMFSELIAATGARQGRVSGAIVALQRDGKTQIVNLGSPVKARWFIFPEGVKVARLSKR